jgi:hypothetical protein
VGTGHQLKTGSRFSLALLGKTIQIANYRTAAPAGRTLSFREIMVVS